MGIATSGSFLSLGLSHTTLELDLLSDVWYDSAEMFSVLSLIAVGRCRTSVLDIDHASLTIKLFHRSSVP